MKLVIQNSARVWGGNEKWLATLAAGLRERGHTIIVSCKRGPVRERLQALGIATTGVRPRGRLDVVSAAAFAVWLRRQKPDALLLTSWVPTPWAAWAGRFARVPRVIVRSGIVREAPRRGVYAYAFAHWIDGIIGNANEIRAAWHAPHPPVHVVLNAMHDRSAERAQLRERLRSELNVAADTLIIAGAGHATKRKGFDILLRAFAAAALPDTLLIIAGDGPERAALAQLAQELGLGETVRFLGHRNDGPDVVAGSDVFAMCSRNEGMANVMLEAMAAGVPVVASAISGVQQALAAESGRPAAGWIVPPDDAAALAGALREIVTSARTKPQLLHEYTSEALHRIRERFGLARMLDECEAVLFRAS